MMGFKRGRSWEGGGPPQYMPPSKRGRVGQMTGGAMPQPSMHHTDDGYYDYEEENWEQPAARMGGFGGQQVRGRGGGQGAASALQGGMFPLSTNEDMFQGQGRGFGRGTGPPGQRPPAQRDPFTDYDETSYNEPFVDNSGFGQGGARGGGFGAGNQNDGHGVPSLLGLGDLTPSPTVFDYDHGGRGGGGGFNSGRAPRGQGFAGGPPRGRGNRFNSDDWGQGFDQGQASFGGMADYDDSFFGPSQSFGRGPARSGYGNQRGGRQGPPGRGRGQPGRGRHGRGGRDAMGPKNYWYQQPHLQRGKMDPKILGSAMRSKVSSKLPIPVRFKNLCDLAKSVPKGGNKAAAFEDCLGDENVTLAPAYVFKAERSEEKQPIAFNCKVYIDNVYIANGVATNKKDARNKACEQALRVLATTSADTILKTHERVNVSALGKSEADIVECSAVTGESNIVQIMNVQDDDPDYQKSAADFYIKQPEEIDESTGMNSTCILRQSADFSHLLLKFEYTLSPQGYACSVNLEGTVLAKATAKQQVEAKNKACDIALAKLRKDHWTILVIKRDKPKPGNNLLTRQVGHVEPNNPASKEAFQTKLKDYFSDYFAKIEDLTMWLSLSPELNQEERDCVYAVAKDIDLRVEAKRVDGKRRSSSGKDEYVFLVVSKKMTCQDLFDYIWEKGGDTWRFKLKPPTG